MASEGPLSIIGSTAGSVGAGTFNWSNASNIIASDGSYATCNLFGATPFELDVYLSKNAPSGTIAGDDNATGATLPASDAYVTYGHSSDLWGQTWTPAEINATSFGVLFRVSEASFTSKYLYAEGFGFSIPTGATVDGIIVEIEQSYSGTTARIDHIRITVYYTEGGGAGAARLTQSILLKPNLIGGALIQ